MVLASAVAILFMSDPRIDEFRVKRAEALMSKKGWLSVAGLFWLENGGNSFGSSSTCKVVFPGGSAPLRAGTLTKDGEKISVAFEADVSASLNGVASNGGALISDTDATSTISQSTVEVGDVFFTIIRRGQRVGVRLYHANNPVRKVFNGLKWFEPNETWKVEADFHPYPKPKKLSILNVIGDVNEVENPGYVTFKVGRKKIRLEAEAAGDGLFFNFKDLSNGKTTYGAGRFLSTGAPVNGKVTLDFNYAVNPPCAYTAFATCPLPPKSNYLTIEIPAGEKIFGNH
jgi:uncharacterized protein